MADAKNANAILKAAVSGDAAKIRGLLAAGAPTAATDVNRMTPVMLAAQGGHAEAFRALVDAGADLHALALDQMDLLESAAEGGDAQIIQFLIDQKHPIEGHWQPRSSVEARMGHITPLYMAAINGHVEAVQVLLKAGANRDAKFDGQTALKSVQEDIKYPNGDEEIERLPRLKAIAALLNGKSTNSESPVDMAAREVARFAVNARRPEHKRLVDLLAEKCGKARSWKPLPDHGIQAKNVIALTLSKCQKQKTLQDLQAEARKAGSHLVLAEPWAPGEDAALVLFPTDDKFAVVAAVGTEGANYNVNTADVLTWMKEVDEHNPFHLSHCGHDLIGGAFVSTVKGANKLAAGMVEICSCCLDECVDSAEELAPMLTKYKAFLLRWD